MVSHQAAEELQQARADQRYATLLTDYEWETYQDILQKVESDQTLNNEEAVLFARVLAIRSSTSNLKGFTSHESLKDSGLTHMNARLYDPELGRFMTPDSMIPEPGKPMAYNRYAYVYNNPATFNDPTGHFVGLAVGLALSPTGLFIGSHLWSDTSMQAMSRVIVTAVVTVATSGLGTPYAVMIAGGTSLAMDAALSGHIQGAEIRSATFAAASAVAASAVKVGMDGKSWYAVTLAHGVTQGTISWLRNGDFKTGFVSGLISHASAAAMDGMGLGDVGGASGIMGRTAVASVFGGMAAEATGGDFAQGAMTAAIVHLFNYEATSDDTCPVDDCITVVGNEQNTTEAGTIKYIGDPPETVPVTGETAEALQCFADTCTPGKVLSVTGGKEKYDAKGVLLHSKKSTHYPENGERAVDLSGWRNPTLTDQFVNACALACGFTHGQWETNHWHIQIGPGNGSGSLPMKER